MVWAYLTGGCGLTVSVFVGVWAVVGGILTAIGSSLAPEKHDVVAGDVLLQLRDQAHCGIEKTHNIFWW